MGCALAVPGALGFAADLACRAASVSHNGEAIYGAQVIAAMVARAFVKRDVQTLINTTVGFIPKDSLI